MRTRNHSLLAYVALLFIAAGALALTGSRPAEAPVEPPPGSSAGVLPEIAGGWSGTWVDTVFTVVGPMNWDLIVEGNSISGTGTCNLSGVGLGSEEPIEFTGTISAARGNSAAFQVEFTNQSSLTSSASGTIGPEGQDNMTGDGNVGAPLNFGDYSFTCTMASGTITGTFQFTGGGAGTILMVKTNAVEEESWGTIKDRYRD